jgi:glutamate/tyrosine decarboxylase-like PLP-dependent enzyme
VVVGAEFHIGVRKALGLLGLGRDRVVTVPADSQGRMRFDLLPPMSGPTIVCVQAGNVNSGSFDPLREITEAAHASGAWVHVDGAFGLWAAASPRFAHLSAGIELADSWATDAHKWLNVPYDSGIGFVRKTAELAGAMSFAAAYLPESGTREPSHMTPELSRRARGIDVWAALRTLGRNGITAMVEGSCAHAQRFADGFRRAGHAILNDVVLNQVLVDFGSPEATQAVIAEIQREGTAWCGGTVWQGKTAMRISVSSWATTTADVDRCLEAMLGAAARVTGKPAK